MAHFDLQSKILKKLYSIVICTSLLMCLLSNKSWAQEAQVEELIFQAVKGTVTATQQVIVTNNTGSNLNITDARISGNFATQYQVASGNTNITLAPNEEEVYEIAFAPDDNANDLGMMDAAFEVTTSVVSLSTGLYGLKVRGYEGSNEPVLNEVLKTLGYSIDPGWNSLADGTDVGPKGDEILNSFFIKANTGDVNILPVGRYSPTGDVAFGYYTYTGSTTSLTQVGKLLPNSPHHQALFPGLESGTTSFDITDPFGIYVIGLEETYTEDDLNKGPTSHAARIYPLKDRDGAEVENSYLVCFEDATNGDYQDYMFVLSNVKLAVNDPSLPSPCTNISSLSCPDIPVVLPYTLDFTGIEAGMQDKNGATTGFTMIQASSGTRLSVDGPSTYTDIPGYEPSQLKITNSNLEITANKGIAHVGNNNQINTLGVGINNKYQRIQVETSIVNPSTGTGYAQTGLWYGLDNDNFVKLVIINNDDIQMILEENGGVSAGNTITLNNIPIGSEDIKFRFLINNSNTTKKVEGYYQIGNNEEVFVGELTHSFADGVTLSDGTTSQIMFAGIFATYRNGSSYTVAYKDFSVSEYQDSLLFSSETISEKVLKDANKTFSLDITATDASSPVVSLTADDGSGIPSWLTVGGNVLDGSVMHNITEPNITFEMDAAGLTDGIYTATVTAGSTGYISGTFTLTLEVSESLRPSVTGLHDGNLNTIKSGSTGVLLDISISSTALNLPNSSLDNSTVNATTITLTKINGEVGITAHVNSTGGGDAITLTPVNPLEANTSYRFNITENVLDLDGMPMEPLSIVFTTGNGNIGGSDLGSVNFTKVDLGTEAEGKYTSLEVGPDGKLYASTIDGRIKRFSINADGSLGIAETFTPFGATPRIIIGMTFAPEATSSDLTMWISYSETFVFTNGPAWDGNIARLKLSPTNTDVLENQLIVDNLPRSVRDHFLNSLRFGPDGALYTVLGGNSAMGKADNSWGNREERLLSGAVLKLDISKLPSTLPLDVKTIDGGGTYDPYVSGAPFTLYATGVRNAYDLVWHSNGELYVPTNGSAAGGNTPTSDPADVNYITPNPSITYTGPTNIPYVENVQPTQNDWLFRVELGGYYGHPNPLRGEYVLNRGDLDMNNPLYDGIQADPNYRGAAYDFGLNKSPNGVIEYRSNSFNGTLQGLLMVVRYSQQDDILMLKPGGVDLDIVDEYDGSSYGMGGFNNPLDLTEDIRNGNIYVAEFGDEEGAGGKITLVKPDVPPVAIGQIELDKTKIIDNVVSGDIGKDHTITITNVGTGVLEITGIDLKGVNAGEFVLNNLISFPQTILQGTSLSFDVAFIPSSTGLKSADIEIVSNDLLIPTVKVNLTGLGTAGLGGTNEPSLQAIIDLYGIPVSVGDDDASTSELHSTIQDGSFLGEEVNVSRFEKAASGPVTIEVLSVFGPSNTDPIVGLGWYESGDINSKKELFTVNNPPLSNAQTISVSTTGDLSFEPDFNIPFGFYSYWPFFQDNGVDRHVYSEDDLNTFTDALPHHVRVYPMKNAGGSIIPYTYLIAFEESIIGFDYQDIVMIVKNIKPYDNDASISSLSFAPESATISLVQESTGTISADLIETNSEELEVTLQGVDTDTGFAPTWLDPQNTTWSTSFMHDAGTPQLMFDVDATGLAIGIYQANITASSPGYQSVTLSVELSVLDSTQTTFTINFQDEPTIPPTGWVRDFGEAYEVRTGANQGTNLIYGWVMALDGKTPVSLLGNGRNRSTSATGNDLLQATMVQMQSTTSGTWELALPNGDYDVTVSVGDLSYFDSQHTINVEGVNAINAFIPNSGDRFLSATVSVEVLDGKLTIDALGGANTKINNVFIEPSPSRLEFNPVVLDFITDEDETLVPAQASVLATSTGDDVAVALTKSSNSDWLVLPQSPVLGSLDFDINMVGVAPGNYTATVIASAVGYGDAELTVNLTVRDVLTSDDVFKINFQRDSDTAPTSWMEDSGDGYGVRAGIYEGEDLTFGWVDADDGISPLDMGPNTRNRDGGATGDDLLEATLVQMQSAGRNGLWEMELPEGRYDVTVSIGDLTYLDSEHTINIEGDPLITAFIPNTLYRFNSAKTTVEVTDGKLTIDAIGGNNTKINYVIIQPTPKQLVFDPGTLQFAVPYEETNTISQATNLSVNTNEDISIALSKSVGSDWLILPNNPAIGDLDFNVDVSGLEPGAYISTVTASSEGYADGILEVTLVVEPLGLLFTGNELNFVVQQGSAVQVPSMTAQVSSLSTTDGSIPALVEVTKQVQDNWILLPETPALGDLTFDVNVGGLAPGSYTTTVLASAFGYADAELIINLEVTPLNPSYVWKYYVNFQKSTSATPTGYIPDIGEAYGNRGDFGGEELTFGWTQVSTENPISNETNMRERTSTNPGYTQEYVTLGQLQNSNPGTMWSMALPNGMYQIQVLAGDTPYIDSKHVINAEGKNVLTFEPTSDTRFATGITEVEVTDNRLDIDAVGGINSKISSIWIGVPDTDNDNLPPAVSIEFDGTELSAGAYKNQVIAKVVAADLGGSGIDTKEYSFDEGVTWNTYSNGLLIDEPGKYTLNARATDLSGNSSTTSVYEFEVISMPLNNAILVLENKDKFPENDELSFSRIQNNWNGNANHDKVVLRVHNYGTEDLRVEDLTISNEEYWIINSVYYGQEYAPEDILPVNIAPNEFMDIELRFVAVDPPNPASNNVKVLHETLTILSNDDENPTKEVQLHGLWQLEGEGFREPSVNQMIESFGLTTATGFEQTKHGSDSTATGDEVISFLWQKANVDQPVYLRQLAAYHGCCNSKEYIKYRDQSGSNDPYTQIKGTNFIPSGHIGLDAQSILPRSNTDEGDGIFGEPAEGAVDPEGLFNMTIGSGDCTNAFLNYPTKSDPTKLGYIGIRMWKLRNSKGEIVPNTYLMANDYLFSGSNYDYNDNLYLIINVRPATGTAYYSELATGNGIADDPDEKQSALEFEDNMVGTQNTKTLYLRSLGQVYEGEDDPDIIISSVEIVGENSTEFSVTNPVKSILKPYDVSSEQPDQTSVEVSFTPANEGLKQAALLIHYNSGDSPKRVPLFGTGTSGCYALQMEKRVKMAAADSNPIDINGETWESDVPYRLSKYSYRPGALDASSEVSDTDNDELYASYMSSTADLKPIGYEIPMADGEYVVRLHLIENFWRNENARINNILIEGEEKELALDIYKEVGHRAALVKDFEVTVEDGILTLEVIPLVNRPVLAAIEVFSVGSLSSLDLTTNEIVGVDCNEATGVIDVTATGTSNTVLYKLGQYENYQSSGRFENLAEGTYTVYVKEDVPGGCEVSRSFEVPVNQSTVSFALDLEDVGCESNGAASAAVVQVTGGTAPYRVIWNDNPFTTGYSVSGLVEGKEYFVTVTDITGCSTTKTFELTKPATCPIRINAAGEKYVSVANEEFIQDEYYSGGSINVVGTNYAGTDDDVLYNSYRFGEFSYNIPVVNGEYTIVLHFAESYVGVNKVGQRVFHVDIEGNRVLTDFDILESTSKFSAIQRQFNTVVEDGEINIDWIKVKGSPLVRAIEVIYQNSVNNNPPTLEEPIADYLIHTNELFELEIPETTFADTDLGDETLLLEATLADDTSLPTWLNFDKTTNRFSGTPKPEDIGNISVKLTASDLHGDSVSDTFEITISNILLSQKTTGVMQGSTNQEILKIEVDGSGTLDVTQFRFNTIGTTSTSDITNARVFYTGIDENLETSIQVGTDITNPDGEFVFNGFTQSLADGINYFWLVYDVASDATLENQLDAELVNATINTKEVIAMVNAPEGMRPIITLDCEAGTALSFNGSAEASILEGVELASTFTIEAWIEPGQNTEEAWILGEETGTHIKQNGSQIEFYLYDGSNLIGPATGSIVKDYWNHIAVVYDGTDLKVYTNGRAGTTVTHTGSNENQGTAFKLGTDNTLSIDEIKIWNKARTLGEIRTNMRLTNIAEQEGLVNYWQFNEGSGLVARDWIGNTTVTLDNTVTWGNATQAIGCGSVLNSVASSQNKSTQKNSTTTYSFTATGTGNVVDLTFTGTAPVEADLNVLEFIGVPANAPVGDPALVNNRWVADNFSAVTTFNPITFKVNLASDIVPSDDSTEYTLHKRDDGTANSWADLTHDPTSSPFVTVLPNSEDKSVAFEGETGNTDLMRFGSVTTGSEFFITSSSAALPVTWLSFTGKRKSTQEVELTWTTASEQNNQGFEVEKSEDAQRFEKVGFVDGAGESFNQTTYKFLDSNESRSMYYRLLQVDLNGKKSYSDIIFIKGDETVNFYPNPFNIYDIVHIQVSENIQKLEKVTVNVVDMTGNTIFTQTGSLENLENILNKQMKNWTNGMYILRLYTNHQNHILKVIKTD